MALFDFIKDIGQAILPGIFGSARPAPAVVPAVVAPTPAPAGDPNLLQRVIGLVSSLPGAVQLLQRQGITLPGVAQLGAQSLRQAGVIGPGGAAAPGGVPPGVMGLRGNGQFARTTLVSTINLQTGQVVRQQEFSGAPFLMNNDIRKLRGIARKVAKANSRLPRKTTKPSPISQLRDATVQQALQIVQSGGARALCPPS